MASEKRKMFGNLVTKVTEVQSSSLYYRKLSWFLFGAETPMLTGGCFLNDGRLLLSDYNNKKLILFDDKYNLVKHFSVDGWPYDISQGTKQGEVYVVLCDDVILRCHVVDNDLMLISKIKVPLDVRTVSVSDDRIFAGSRSAVFEIKPDGSITNIIKKSGGNCYIAISSEQQTLFHKDGDHIICRTLEGKELYKYEDKLLNDPRGMCLDHDENLYVCGYKSHNLFQISPGAEKGRVVLRRLHKINNPLAIVYHPYKQQFIVTSYGEDTAFEVYQVSGF